jgi:hypothetical protein
MSADGPPWRPSIGVPLPSRLPGSLSRIVLVAKLSTRLATLEDAAAIAAMYDEGMADRIATFETEPRTPEQIGATKSSFSEG